MKISFIIPVYNVSPYIEKCVLSIINQNIALESFEIIIINDGSTDDSGQIIDSLKNRFLFIKVLHQENKGLGAARNSGLKLATGDYIFFIDSDDFLIENTVTPLIDRMRNKNYDFIAFNWFEIYPEGKYKRVERDKRLYGNVLSGENYLNNHNIKGGVWAYLFSTDFIKKNFLLMPEGIYHEDIVFLAKAFASAKNIYFTDLFVYGYLQRSGSITKNNSLNQQKLQDILFSIKELSNFKETRNFPETISRGLKRRIDFLTAEIIVNIIRMEADKNTIHYILSELRALGLFPLTASSYSLKFSVFKNLMRSEKSVYMFSKLNALF